MLEERDEDLSRCLINGGLHSHIHHFAKQPIMTHREWWCDHQLLKHIKINSISKVTTRYFLINGI